MSIVLILLSLLSYLTSTNILFKNPYDSFMKKHLQHYGYFTGRNLTIKRFGFEPKKGYKSNCDSDDSDTESSTSDANSTANNNNNNNKPQFKPRPIGTLNENFKWWINQKDLYSLGFKEIDYQREPRWPIEMQVLPERVKHIITMPNFAEPFYMKTGLEETPMTFSDPKNKTVFYYNPLNCGYFVKSRIGGSREGCQKVCGDLGSEAENTLIFESRFESGNLMKAIKISETDYQLYLRYDLYTNKHTQWYYFRVTNAKPNQTYRFTICNFLKSDSLYNNGMKPLMYSEFDAQHKNLGWRRWGSNIKYYKNNIRTEEPDGTIRQFYSLTWTCTFPNENDTYYFAHCYPYTYSDLQEYLKEIQEDPVRNKFCKIKILCRTLAENIVHLITITNPAASAQENKAKKGVVITARVHPGETNSSYMMKGFLDFLLGNSADAKLLRENFVFKVIPMLNPDGVVIGNYRCSLTGRDLNRNYKTLLKEAFPSPWHTREMIKRFTDEREVVMYCDLHGHSRRNNVFIYGCHNNKDTKKRFKERVFPAMMNKNASSVFSYNACKFKIQKSKEGTGRIVMWNMGILNSFTMEATFSGSSLGNKAGTHFTTKDFESLGYYFCDTLLDYCDPDQTKVKLILSEIEAQMKEAMRKKMEQRGIYVENANQIDLDSANVNLDELSSGEESSDDGGSDSSADDGLPLHLERFAKNKDKRSGSFKSNEPIIKEADKRTLKPIMNTQLQAQLLSARPRSAKALNNGIPIFTHERAEERLTKKHQSTNQLDDTIPTPPQQNDLSGVSLRYQSTQQTQATPNNIVLPQQHTHLCESHKKKLTDFFLFRHLTSVEGFNENNNNKDNKTHQPPPPESDGNASDDEAEFDEVDERPIQHSSLARPTFEEYVNKYVFTKSVSLRNKTVTSHNTLPRSRVFNISTDTQPLEIKSIMREPEQETYNPITSNNTYANNNTSNAQKDVYDFLPKHLIKQMNEKKVLNLSTLGNNTGTIAAAATIVSSNTLLTNTTTFNSNLLSISEINVKRTNSTSKTTTPKKQQSEIQQQQQQQQPFILNHNVHTPPSSNNNARLAAKIHHTHSTSSLPTSDQFRQEDLTSPNNNSNTISNANITINNSSMFNNSYHGHHLKGQFEKSVRPPLMRQKITK